jgi:hypothetical protein
MAGDWIKMRIDLQDDPAVFVICESTALDEFQVIGRLHKLWSWADKHTANGVTPGVNPKWVDRYVNQPGFAEAMILAGWLSFDGEVLSFPGFEIHNGKSAKSRCHATIRQRESRTRHADVTEICDTSVTEALPEKRREEKRRETIKKTDSESRNLIPFSSQDFSDAWQLWHRHRLNVHKPIGDIESDAQLMELAKHPESEAIAILNYSVQVGARNLILTGDHHKKPAEKAKTNANGKRLIP